MSRWAELFFALSAPDTMDTPDTRSGLSPRHAVVSASVEKCRYRRRVTAPPRKVSETLAKAPTTHASVNWVDSVKGVDAGEAEQPSPRPSRAVDTARHFATLGPGTDAEWIAGIAKLDRHRPPADMPSGHWAQIVNNIMSFAASPFRAQAALLGWDLVDLVGADPIRPFGRIDRCGLLLLFGGHHLVALTADSATVETNTGARQTYYRTRNDCGRVLAWDLVQ